MKAGVEITLLEMVLREAIACRDLRKLVRGANECLWFDFEEALFQLGLDSLVYELREVRNASERRFQREKAQ